MDIADKHHSLLVTLVAVGEATINVNTTLRNFKAPPFALPHFQEPLKNGDVFFVCEPRVEHYTKIDFDIALIEPEIIRGRPLVKMLGQLVQHVNNTVDSFEKFLV